MSLLNSVQKKAPSLPSRVVLYAAEKFGKSSFACFAPDPIFLMTAGETGLLSLMESGRVPDVSHFPDDFRRWKDFIEALVAIKNEKHNHKTLVIDTGNGAENLCVSHIMREYFDDDLAAFNNYGKGISAAQREWAKLLQLLDDIRLERGMPVLILHHAKVKTFQDPAGKDWDQWRPESIDKLWGLTHKWSDVILFGGFKVTVNKQDKATSEERYLRTSASAAIVAGNRYGLPNEITAAAGAENLWKAFSGEMRKAKGNGRPKQQEPTPVKEEIVPTGTDKTPPVETDEFGEVIPPPTVPAGKKGGTK